MQSHGQTDVGDVNAPYLIGSPRKHLAAGKDKDYYQDADGCKRLIENAIVCWNYMYLSKMMHDTSSDEERESLINTIKSGSVVTWQHINLQGEYDFLKKI